MLGTNKINLLQLLLLLHDISCPVKIHKLNNLNNFIFGSKIETQVIFLWK